MKKITFIILLFLTLVNFSWGQKSIFYESEDQKEERMAWWKHDRFGMFIHWGLYSLPARHEWVKRWERMNDAQYAPYFDMFNPDLFNPKEWAKKAKEAGMKYAVLTTKHHDGFCLFDSKYTDYKATNTAADQDLVRKFVDAFRAEGIKIGFYYSLLDWHHPDFTVDVLHPLEPADTVEDREAAFARLNKGRDIDKYRRYMKNQITELLTNYGKIDIMWLDFSYPGHNGHGKGKEDWDSIELLKLIKRLQPGIIVDNRLDLDNYVDGADFATPEQVKPEELQPNYGGLPFETCQTFSGSWGYYRDENTWKTNHELLTLLITAVSKSGNLILNVGPTARGEFDFRAVSALDSIGSWMKYNEKAIYGCTMAPEEFEIPEETLLTYNPETKRLYIHLMDVDGEELVLPGYSGKVKYAQFLHDNSELRMEQSVTNVENLVLKIPVNRSRITIPVIELILN